MAKNKLRCNVTGLWYGVSKARRDKLIEREGSFEAVIENYVSRDANRLLKEGKSVEEIQAMVEVGDLTSNTAAPKRASTRGEVEEVKSTKAPVTAPVEPEVAEEVTEDDEVDPDVKAFLEGTETGSASEKAI